MVESGHAELERTVVSRGDPRSRHDTRQLDDQLWRRLMYFEVYILICTMELHHTISIGSLDATQNISGFTTARGLRT